MTLPGSVVIYSHNQLDLPNLRNALLGSLVHAQTDPNIRTT